MADAHRTVADGTTCGKVTVRVATGGVDAGIAADNRAPIPAPHSWRIR
jgi:hypothetical protein